MKPAMTQQQAEFTDDKKSGAALYRELAAGKASLASFLFYEFYTTLFSGLGGALGFGLRSLLAAQLFGSCGKRPALGKGLVVRRPKQIALGNKVLVDDYATLDARGDSASISLGDHVSIGRFSTITAKDGQISLASGVNVGSYSRLATQTKITIGESVLVAAFCYIGPGNHKLGDGNTPLIANEMDKKGGVTIGAHAWIGSHVTVLDGVSIGEGAIIGAHSLVLDNVPAKAVAAGVPARVIKSL